MPKIWLLRLTELNHVLERFLRSRAEVDVVAVAAEAVEGRGWGSWEKREEGGGAMQEVVVDMRLGDWAR